MYNLNNSKQPKISLRKDKEWKLIDSELCLVTNFTPLMGSTVEKGIVISPVTSTPYASVEIKCRKLENITAYITHKIDFMHLWAAFKERGIIKEQEEVLIYWTTKHYKYRILKAISKFMLTILGSTPFPKLIVMICPKGTYKSFEFRPDGFRLLPDYKVMVFVYGLMSIKWWLPDVIE